MGTEIGLDMFGLAGIGHRLLVIGYHWLSLVMIGCSLISQLELASCTKLRDAVATFAQYCVAQ